MATEKEIERARELGEKHGEHDRDNSLLGKIVEGAFDTGPSINTKDPEVKEAYKESRYGK